MPAAGINVSVPITGGAAAPSGVDAQNRIGFGSVLVNNSSSGMFWVFVLGMGYFVWKSLSK